MLHALAASIASESVPLDKIVSSHRPAGDHRFADGIATRRGRKR
jgi:hypothetical protein